MKCNKFDHIEKLACGSLIQHGHYNDRIYLMKVARDYPDDLPQMLIDMAKKNKYSKIFAKLPLGKAGRFVGAGYQLEASVPELCDSGTGVFLAFYLDEARKHEDKADLYTENIVLTFDADKKQIPVLDSGRFIIRPCNPEDVNRMVEIYKKVFLSYPFPIHEDEYILKTMKDNIDYFCVETGNKIIALSSAEKDDADSNAEMTDFATLPEWRGNSLSVHLLQRMEEQVKTEGINTAYTIARAASPGMNITFARTGYSFGGRLINNTNISGTIESMNVWYKQL